MSQDIERIARLIDVTGATMSLPDWIEFLETLSEVVESRLEAAKEDREQEQ